VTSTSFSVTATDAQFARLRSPSQFATVQLLSSFSVVVIFPLQMTRQWHRLLQIVIGYPQPYDDHVDNVATTFFCRSLAQNVTMVGFLGERHTCPPRDAKLTDRLADYTPLWAELSWVIALEAKTGSDRRYLPLLPLLTESGRSLYVPLDVHRFLLDLGKWRREDRAGSPDGAVLTRRHPSWSARSSPDK